MAKETSSEETRCLVYKRSGVWHEKVQRIDDFYSKPIVRPADPNVLVEFVSPRFKQHYQVEVARKGQSFRLLHNIVCSLPIVTDIKTLRTEHRSFQVELGNLKNDQLKSESRLGELNAQIRAHEQESSLWQEKEANLSQENLNVRSKLATLNQRYLALESLQRETQQKITTQNEQINSLKDRLNTDPSEASKGVARENQLLMLRLKAQEDLNATLSQNQEQERRQEFAKLNSTIAEQTNEIQILKDQLAHASTKNKEVENLQAEVRDLQQQNASVSTIKKVLEDAVGELQISLAMRDPPSSAQNLAARKEILNLKMQLKELERSTEAAANISKANQEQLLSNTLSLRTQCSKIASDKLTTLGLLANTSVGQEAEIRNDGKEETGSLNFFYVFSGLIDTLDRQLSISANFQDEHKRKEFVNAKISAQKYLNDLGTINYQLWDPKISTSRRTSYPHPEISCGSVPASEQSNKRPLDTPPLLSAKRVKLNSGKREQDSRYQL